MGMGQLAQHAQRIPDNSPNLGILFGHRICLGSPSAHTGFYEGLSDFNVHAYQYVHICS